jgi:alpha-beta hydrolase superfamily lysophospholipase
MAEAVAQAIAEIRALTGWLLQEGCPAVALWGVSMGGWLAGLTVCRDARLSAVVMTVPTVRRNPTYALLKRRPGPGTGVRPTSTLAKPGARSIATQSPSCLTRTCTRKDNPASVLEPARPPLPYRFKLAHHSITLSVFI